MKEEIEFHSLSKEQRKKTKDELGLEFDSIRDEYEKIYGAGEKYGTIGVKETYVTANTSKKLLSNMLKTDLPRIVKNIINNSGANSKSSIVDKEIETYKQYLIKKCYPKKTAKEYMLRGALSIEEIKYFTNKIRKEIEEIHKNEENKKEDDVSNLGETIGGVNKILILN